MKKIYSLFAILFFAFAAVNAQTFTDNSNLIGNYNSGGCTGVVDMDSDGFDDIVVLDQSYMLHVLYQQNNGTFTEVSYGDVSDTEQWGMCIGDYDNDGHKDVFCGGYYDGMQVINIDGPGDYELIELDEDYDIFTQAVNFADINNDGWLDAFACHDDGESHIWGNDGNGNLVPHNDWIDMTVYANSDNSGNYGTVWSDFDRDGDIDLFIAKCRQFISDPYDPRRTNVLMLNDGNNNYHDVAAERGLVNLQQSWTVDFADLDNDGDWDCFLTTHSGTLEIYENDGQGYFTNVTDGSGLEVSGFFLQAKFADFDNDGYVDLLHSGGDHGYYHNDGDMTFTLINNTFPANSTMHSFGIGDLNRDGFLDLYASYGDGYVDADMSHDDRIWMNDGGSNNFIVFDLTGTVSNKDAVGATVEIHGSFGVKIREVRAGESYGITNCFATHFGIGSATEVELAIVYWPSGLVSVIENPEVNSWVEVTEETCNTASATISANGNTSICEGQSVTLTVDDANGDYIWSNDSQASSIEVNIEGEYHVVVWDAMGCATLSNIITIDIITPTVPTVSFDGETSFCEGSEIELIASAGNSYLWSNGLTAQAIVVTESGTYSVEVMQQCGSMESESVVIEVYDSPDAPTVNDVTLPEAGTTTLVASGTNISWYDAVDGTTPIATGNSFDTPFISSTTSWWAEDVIVHGNEPGNGGKPEKEGVDYGTYSNTPSYYLIFDVAQDIYLDNVKVYANTTANRNIKVFDQLGVVVAEGVFNIPQGESVVNLNFFIPAGENYSIRCTSNNPQLWRDKNVDENAPFDYPYNVDGLASITGTSVAGNDFDNYYYFFYDWNVHTPEFACPGERTEATVTIVGIEELEIAGNVTVYPNPAADMVNLSFDMLSPSQVNVSLINSIGDLVRIYNFSDVVSGKNLRQMDIQGINAGVYQLRFEVNGKSVSRTLAIN